MTSKVLKCSNCNVVINELLSFIQNKVEIMKDESIVNLCSTAFTEEDVMQAKNLLYESIKTADRNVARRKGKLHKNIQDMVSLMRRVHPDEIPVFVARDLHKLPPVTFDHLDCTRLLKDIIMVKNDIEFIQEKYVPRTEFDTLRKEFSNLKEASLVNNFEGSNYVNTIRGKYSHANRLSYGIDIDTQDSGPYGILNLSNKESQVEKITTPITHYRELEAERSMTATNVDTTQLHSMQLSRSALSSPPVVVSRVNTSRKRVEASTAVSNDIATPCERSSSRPNTPECEELSSYVASGRVEDRTVVSNITAVPAQSTLLFASGGGSALLENANETQCNQSFASKVKEGGDWKQTVPDDNWVTVQRKRLQNRFIGLTGKAVTDPVSKFKAANLKVPLFIDYVDKNASVADICQYIFNKTQVSVEMEKISTRKVREYNSYKVLVPRQKFAIFMNRDLWPDGIIFRRFVNFKKDM